jgi:SAM-dependent methyltransferase
VTLVEFTDPRLVAVYDAINAYGPGEQPDFYAGLARERGAATVVDLGCGTGMLTRRLAEQGYRMIGIDPAPAMLAVARRRPGAGAVRWIDGDASLVAGVDADLAIMTGHVAQFFLTDEQWHAALVALHAALRPGGALAFESRDPDARGWEQWTRDAVVTVDDADAGPIETWSEVAGVADGIVSYTIHYRFEATGETLTAPGRLRFRSAGELDRSLADAGFAVEQVYGDWDRRAPGATTGELVVVASR